MTIEEAIHYFENIPRGSVIEIDPGAIITALRALYKVKYEYKQH